jgi:hypothetical protein
MGAFDWLRWDEEVSAMETPAVDIGIGRDAGAGLGSDALADLVRDNYHDLTDRGANLLVLRVAGREVRLYARRRGRHVDVGTRRDFAELGWEALCDLLDRAGRGPGEQGRIPDELWAVKQFPTPEGWG